VATARIPKGAVASELAKEGKKKTTFFDLLERPVITATRYVNQRVGFVTKMSRGCHFFFGPVFLAGFGVRVGGIVTMLRVFDQATLPFRTSCVIAGTRCLVSTNSYDVLRATALLQAGSKSNGLPSFEMQVLVDEALDDLPEQSAHFRGRRHLVFALLPHRSFVAYDLLRKRAHAALSPAAASDCAFWHSLLLPITIGVLGTTVGAVPVHSACLEEQGTGVLIAGVSGAGKSTLATALGQRGFTMISDDWTYLSDQKSTLVAHGLFAPVKLLPDAARFFADLENLDPRRSLNGELAYEFDPRSSMNIMMKDISCPQYIFFLERTPAPGCFMVPCRHEYVREFFQKNAERLPDELAAAKAFREKIVSILSSCRSWILRTGDSPSRTAEALADFLQEARHGRG